MNLNFDELHGAQPGLRVEGGRVFVDAKPQLGNALVIGDHGPDFLIGGHFLTRFHKNLLQAGVH